MPGGTITTDGTYYWRAKNVDSSSVSSSYSATRSFVVDTTPPTISSAAVAADGVTVTATWSENLDQAQAVAGSAFTVNAIAGTGTVSYPAANQTRFTLASTVHHLDVLSLDYTKPGSDPMVRDTAISTGNPAATVSGISVTNNTANLAPATPTLVSPANGAQLNSATPTLTATFSDPDTQDTGKVTFEVCSDGACTSSLGTFDSTSTTLTFGANGSAAIPGGTITTDGTYYWRAKNVDSSSASSSYSATRSFVVDTTPPTISSAAVGSDGTTVTVTWSEDLDQAQAVAGSAFTVNAIAGTGTVSYPAADQTQLSLASAVHHLDVLSLDYTQPGGTKIRDTATPAGNAAATASGVSVTNNTANLAPSTPTLVTPGSAARVNTATPTLTATFSDPDPNDTGTVTFEVCSDAACSSSLGTFQSGPTANAANGSASVPGGTITADGTYYWRAQNVDSSSATSSFSATRSFVLDTTPPTITAATVGANGTTVTVTWSENLDQTQAVPGSAFSIAPNGGSSIAGTAAAVTYPAANETRFTLSSAVHHLDTLALGYSKPGSDPMVRDAATPAGNAAATASLGNGSITNGTTNATPDVPTLVDPLDASTVGTHTPTLTATFSDPDTNDSGKLTFEVCIDAACTSSLGTFDSTSTSLTNGQQGSGVVPGLFGLLENGLYYWRVASTDSSSAMSSYSSTYSFTSVTNSAPDVPTLVSPADGAYSTTATPALTATFDDPDAGDTGRMTSGSARTRRAPRVAYRSPPSAARQASRSARTARRRRLARGRLLLLVGPRRGQLQRSPPRTRRHAR